MREEATSTMTPPGRWCRRWAGPLAALLLVFAACRSVPPTPASPLPILPESALTGYSTQTQTVDAETIAGEVADPDSVAPVLEGMRSGSERRFSSRREPEQQVISRTIRFTSIAEASGYVSWLDHHAADVLGAAPRREVVDVSGSVAYSRDPQGCCPGKEMMWWLVTWARGPDALVLMVGGTRVRPAVVGSLAAAMDEQVGAA